MTQVLKTIGSILIALFVVWFFFGGGIEQETAKEIQKIENQVALDSEKEYWIAKRNGSAMDAYVQASFVAAAYLQANDEANYAKWKRIEAEEARNAGIEE